MKSITLGQFYPADSILHRADPRMKVILTVLYIVATFLAKNVLSFALLLLSALVLILVSKIPMKLVIKSIRPILFIMAFTALINVFFTGGETVLVEWKFIHIYLEGVYQALFMVTRIVVLILGTSMLLTYTPTPIMLTDALEQLLAPLRLLHVPVHEFAMMMTIALRFIPTIMEETEKIMSAQKARGADFTQGSLAQRAKALIPIIVPLFASVFRRADELATAMECRCYHGGDDRTKMKLLRYSLLDFVTYGIGAVLLGGIIAIVCVINKRKKNA